jgi:C4-dicarboxylate-specific signal transduction histidine kinase
MAHVVSDGTYDVLGKVDELTDLLHDRYQLSAERDRDDPICANLRELKQAILDVPGRCAEARRQELRKSLSPLAEEVEEVGVEDVLAGVFEVLRPGFAYHRLSIPDLADGSSPHIVHAVRGDVEKVLEEMVFSALDAYDSTDVEDAERELSAVVAVVRDEMQSQKSESVEVQIADGSTALDKDVCEQINRGASFGPEAGRAFGLSLAHRLARDFGGRLTITPGEKRGNTVALRIRMLP